MDAPGGLSERGQALWVALDAGLDLSGPQGVLAHEACRIADRLAGLDDVIAGRGVLQLMRFRSLFDLDDDDERHFTITVDSVLSESRQQQLALKQVLAALGVEKAPAAKTSGGSVLDQLAARRAGKPDPTGAARAARRG